MTAAEVWILIGINAFAWGVIHIGFAWAGMQLSPARFDPESWFFRTHSFERGGRLYERLFAVKQWKELLPDGATLFKAGFPKKSLAAADQPYLERFIVETCRGEAVHWAVLLAAGPFFLWNPPWAGCIMIVYGVAANVPCIVTQRYNRVRMKRLLALHLAKS